MEELNQIEFENTFPPKRPFCNSCQRPKKGCWCDTLPLNRLIIQTHVIILQHPFEEQRRFCTARVLELSLCSDHISVYIGKKFSRKKFAHLLPLLEDEHSFLLFPRRESVYATAYPPHLNDTGTEFVKPRHLVLIDGTWSQAKQIYNANPILKAMKKICLPPNPTTGELDPSAFVVRRQPYVGAVCTLEAVAKMLDLWEPKQTLNGEMRSDVYYRNMLLRTLERICEIQSMWKNLDKNGNSTNSFDCND